MSANIPFVAGLGTMGVTRNYAGTIEGCVDKPQEVMIKEKINGINQQMLQVADAFIREDNKEQDLCDQWGKVIYAQHGEVTGDLGTIVEYDTRTGKPISFACGNEQGTVECEVTWNDKGKIESMTQKRNLPNHVESVEIRMDKEKGILYYEEKYQKLPVYPQPCPWKPNQTTQ